MRGFILLSNRYHLFMGGAKIGMIIVCKYILNNLRDRKLRTLVMLLSIMLSTTLLFVSLSIGDSYGEAQRKMARGMAGRASLCIASGASQRWIPKEDVPAASNIGQAVGILKANALFKDNGYYENFDVIAADIEALSVMNPPRIVQGASLDTFSGNQIILPDRFASKFDIVPGDTFPLWIEDSCHTFTVSAIAAYDTVFLRNTRGVNTLIPIDTLSAILGVKDVYTQVMVITENPAATADLQTALQASLPEWYSVSQVVNEAQVEADAQQKSMPFYLISFFSLTMSIFIIFSSYKVITLERLPVIGTFRSIGATEKIVTRILLLESLVYGGVGALLGIPVGFGVLGLLLRGLGNSLSQGIGIPMEVSAPNILLACMVSILASTLSAWLPIRRASRLPVKEVVLGHVEEQRYSDRRRFGLGAALLLLCIPLPHLGRALGDNALLLLGGFSLLGLLLGAIILIPVITNGIAGVLERMYGALFGNTSRLAARNIRGNKNVIQNITLLFISISAIIAIAVVGNFVQVYIGDVFRGAKLDGFSDATMTSGFVEQVKGLEGMDEVLPVRVLSNIQLQGDTLARVEGTEDIGAYSEMFAMAYAPAQGWEGTISSFNNGRNLLLSDQRMRSLGVKIGDTVMLSTNGNGPGGSAQFQYTVLGSFKIRSTNTDAILPSRYAAEDFGAQYYGILAYTAADADAVMVQIRDLFGTKEHWSRTVEEFNADAMGTVGAFLQPMQNLTWFILMLATVGIMNNLLISHIQRRCAAAMYKSVGLSNRQSMYMTLVEGFTSGLIGALVAVVISYMEIKTIFMVAGPRISMQPQLSWNTFLLAGALGIAITLLGSIAPIIRSRRMRIVEELKFE